ncbi:hypothetical protein [Xylanimonas sp. McL0601]|uniref:hypothetical protein n=1 Tax=Xylanimonas sp. McL0601 TaxID=3414739 RepID=UPI003CF74F6B
MDTCPLCELPLESGVLGDGGEVSSYARPRTIRLPDGTRRRAHRGCAMVGGELPDVDQLAPSSPAPASAPSAHRPVRWGWAALGL